MDQSSKASSSKRQADSQTSPGKKVKRDSNEYKKIQQVINILTCGNHGKCSDEDFFEAVFPHLSHDEILKINQVMDNITSEKTDGSSKQTVCSQQQIRSYWKQALLYMNKLRDKFEFMETPIVNDGSLINQLDDDCLAQIFMYLPPEKRLEMAKVCQQWQRALLQAWSDVKKLDYDYSIPERDIAYTELIKRLVVKFQLNTQMILYCGRYLEELNISYLPLTEMIKTIKFNCTNLVKLQLKFTKIIKDEDFDDIFFFMPNLKSLEMRWNNQKSMPVTFIKSLNRVTDTLEDLKLIIEKLNPEIEENRAGFNDFPELWISTFRRFESLRTLVLEGYNFDDELIDAISEKKSLVKLCLNANLDSDTKINVHPISSLENLEHLQLVSFSMTNSFLINLANNSKNLKYLSVHGSCISDVGIMPLTKLAKLEEFEIGLDEDNDSIDLTDESIEKFKNMKRIVLINCTEITDYSIIKVLENSPELEEMLFIDMNLTEESFKEAARITRNRKNNIVLRIFAPGEMIPEDISENPDYTSPWLTVSDLES